VTTLHYLVGEPGVGKSWIMDRLTEGYHQVPFDFRPRLEGIYQVHEPPEPATLRAYELGARVGKHPEGFPGTDAMSMTAIVDVHRWLIGKDTPDVPVLGEGARLAVRRLIQACSEGGHVLHVYLICDPQRAAAQRAARGSMQNESWIKGARTRAGRFADAAAAAGADVDYFGCKPPEDIVTAMRRATGL
jgi:hypothetical protein